MTHEHLYGADLVRAHGLFSLLKEDFECHRQLITTPGLQALVIYRYGTWTRTIRSGLLRKLLRLPYWAGYIVCRNVYGIELFDQTKIGRRLHIGHQNGIVIHPDAIIGDDCTIIHGVTLGASDNYREGEAPQVGDRVRIGANAIIIGRTKIGDDARIGPNTVIQSDIPAGATVFMQAPKIERKPEA